MAAKWYQLAVNQGSEQAMNNLGRMYAKGLGVVKDENKAFQLMMDSALRDNPPAMINLGDYFQHGIGCQRNYATAKEWFLKAKEKGSDVSEYLSALESQ